MKVAYTVPAKGELYVIQKKEAVRIVRALCPELPLLAFQTMHGPKMDSDIPYLATLSTGYIRLLSVRAEFMSDVLQSQFSEEVLPYLCRSVTHRLETSYSWPSVIVLYQGIIREIGCSEGWLFPSREEIVRKIRKYPQSFHSVLKQHWSVEDGAANMAHLLTRP